MAASADLGGRPVFRVLRWFTLVGMAWATVANLPGLARYLRMRAM